MPSPIRYGRQLVIAEDEGVMTMTEEVFANFQPVKQTTIYTETVHIKDDQEILGHFLQMLDRQKRGEIDCIGLQVLRNKQTGTPRIEKTWIVPE